MRIFGGNANPELTANICEGVGMDMGKMQIDKFPDSEISVRINENIRGKDIFIIQPTGPPVNDNLMELLIMVDAAKRASASRITAVVPYYGYARQDRKDRPRVPITAKLVANVMVSSGVDRMILLDLHSHQIQGFFDIPVDHLYASPVFIRHYKEIGLKDVVVVAPDLGGVKKAHSYSGLIPGASFAVVSKKRLSDKKVKAQELIGDVEGKKCVLVDDMTSTAGTLCAAAEILKERGASEIYASVTHSLITQSGLDRLKNSPIRELFVTDSIPSLVNDPWMINVLSVAALLGEAILRVHSNQSVSSLFKETG